jgi:hypothetical protein
MEIDREIIENGKWFEDQHMNFSQSLLKVQFPHYNGLRLTCLQNQTHLLSTTNVLQIMNIKDKYWPWIAGIKRGDTVLPCTFMTVYIHLLTVQMPAWYNATSGADWQQFGMQSTPNNQEEVTLDLLPLLWLLP